MNPRERDALLVRELIGTAEAMGQAMTPTAAAVIVSDLEGIPVPVIQKALRDVRATYKGRLTFPVIREYLDKTDGRLEPDEAWALALLAQDERETVVWTEEVMRAFDAARPVLAVGDKVGARMAFIKAYERLVRAARDRKQPAEWQMSLGWDTEKRAQALEQAVKMERLPMEKALALGYDPDPQPMSADGRAIVALLAGPAEDRLLALTADPQTREALAKDQQQKAGKGPAPKVAARLAELRQSIIETRRRREQERQERIERERRELAERKARIAELAEAAMDGTGKAS